MPRTARAIEAGMVYHVLNRGNGRMRLFHKSADYAAFERVLTEGLERYPVDLLTYCVMPNHWHLVVRPSTGESLGRLIGWLCVTHVRRHHEHYHTRGRGHLYQGRFKSFPVAEDHYYVTLCRYVEANPLRAGLVERAEQWRWSGLWRRLNGSGDLPLCKWPVEQPRNWLARVNRQLNDAQVQTIRVCVERGRPLGPETWVRQVANRLGLTFTLRGPGRPRKNPK
jgi:putative transposase